MSETLKLIKVSEIFSNVSYEVPIYQRNYAWGTDQIEQLIDDIETANSDYFIGNLIVNQKDNNVYEVIDGQQRLTTLFILERYLGMTFSKEALRFEAREKSNRTLAALPDMTQLIEELQSDEIKEGYKIISDYFKKTGLDKTQFIERLHHVNIIRVQVPAKIDLNHYFEIMNTRGEQLELHEIAKANLMGQLTSPKAKKIAKDIWEYCSNMDAYVQMNFPSDKRNQIFTDDWSDLSPKINSFEALEDSYGETSDKEEARSLQDIIDNKPTSTIGKQDETDENERFEAIISFPNFLLQVNEAITRTTDDDASLDDKNLLANLAKNWESETAAKNFFFTLLKARVIFDKYVLKREYARDYKETGKWSLQQLKKYVDYKSRAKPQYLSTFGEEADKDNTNASISNKQLRTLQSALRITYTSPKTMHWISLILASYLKNEEDDILKSLEQYAASKVKDSQYKTKSGFGFDRIVFTYLDYLLYREGFSYQGETIVTPLADDWQFQFRSSIEHFYPQHPSEQTKWPDAILNSFGNLALITVSGNSTFSNAMPIGKASTNPGIIEQSLKLRIMAAMMRKNNNQWTEDLAKEHQAKMFDILSENI
ncbi:DUF262 domain-containing protein [Streptococcus sp. CSL10205-OR2]|uniref:DUF262 domain-containing protein n=1 Tax=Streptococcus sp. CSL10205-OR2 TaxID=2980558 RepID=UPI0021D85F89|nr:DUF262 domain-containing HNH endonuclease family protein [Streptococcus sp. CSL10205-OR2]MCU9533701.1 DUF262 domain-containing HNH endonuclease family protein [Streptococcus sp. CSL10205-OR2]